MKRTKKNGPTNVTHERLAGLPFKKASDLKQAQEEIQRAIWRRLEEAKTLDEYLQRDDYRFWREEFQQGLLCRYGAEGNNLVRVYSDGNGIKIDINEAMNTQTSNEALLGTLIKAMSESFAATYYKAKGFLPLEKGPEHTDNGVSSRGSETEGGKRRPL